MNLKDRISTTRREFEQALAQATTLEALEAVRITYLGRQGTISQLTDELKTLPVEEKRLQVVNIYRDEIRLIVPAKHPLEWLSAPT